MSLRKLSGKIFKLELLIVGILISSFTNAWADDNNLIVSSAKCEFFRIPPTNKNPMEIYTTLVAEDFYYQRDEALEIFANYLNSPACVFDDGRPKIAALTKGYSRAFTENEEWNKAFARIQELKKKYPQKGFVALAEAQYWIDYAWDARGGGFASSVTPDGWKLFRQRIEKAEAALVESKPYASALPGWYELMIIVQTALHRSELDRDKTFLEGAQKFKTYFPIYFTMLGYLTPKWGGSWETVDNFVKWSVDNTKNEIGDTIYARLYWVASGHLMEDESLFKNTKVTWPKMKKGFEDLMSQYPQSNWNLNHFAKFACQAGDKNTFLKLRKQIGEKIDQQAWGKPSLDLCEAKYGY